MIEMMKNSGRTLFCVLLAICLMGTMTVPAFAAGREPLQPYSSAYLSNYNAYVYPAGNGVVQVWFNAAGTRVVDCLGSQVIQLYESIDGSSFSWVATFTSSSYPSMMGYQTGFHSSHVTYSGIPGRYYMAYVNIYGGPAQGGTSRYFWTASQIA